MGKGIRWMDLNAPGYSLDPMEGHLLAQAAQGFCVFTPSWEGGYRVCMLGNFLRTWLLCLLVGVHEGDGFGLGKAALMTVNAPQSQGNHDEKGDHYPGKQLPQPGWT